MKSLTLKPATWAALAAMVAVPAFADNSEKELDAVTVTSAAGYEQKLVEAPASISIITTEDLRSKPYTSLIDAVRELEGVDVGETRDKTGQATISMRGMGSDYTLVLINGRRQNNHGDIYPNNFGGNQFNHIPPLDAIERIEIIRGPASTLYGADAMGGVINIITKGVSDKWSGSVTHSRTMQSDDDYGDDITTDFHVSGPIIKDVLGLTVRGSAYNRLESNPKYDDVTDPSGTIHSRELGFGGGGKTVDNDNKSIGATLSWTPTQNQRIFFDIDTYQQKYDNSQGQLGTVDGIDSIWRTATTAGIESAAPRVGYSEDQEFTRDSWSIAHDGEWSFGNSFVSFQQVKTNNNGRTLPFTVAERQDLYNIIKGNDVYSTMSENERKTLAENKYLPRPKRTMESEQFVLDAKLDIPFELAGQHTAVIGGQVIRGELTDGVFGMENSSAGKKQKHNMWSVFAEDTWYIFTPFALTAGARYDKHQEFGDQVSPHLYGVYNLTSNWTIKGGISTGFKTPNTTDMYDGVIGFGGQGTIPLYGNSDIKPETSRSSEIAVYWEHPNGHNFNVTAFRNDFKDKIASQPCGPGTGSECTNAGDYEDLGYTSSSKKMNIDKVQIEGIEVAGRIQIIDSVSLKANYTYTDSEQKSGIYEGYPLGGTAKHMLNSTLNWQANDDFNLFLTLEARDKRFRGFGRGNVLNEGKDGSMYYKAYEMFHLGFSYQVTKNVKLGGRINNLFDKDFSSYEVAFEDDGNGNYTPTFYDDYNNIDKRRNYWLSMNVAF